MKNKSVLLVVLGVLVLGAFAFYGGGGDPNDQTAGGPAGGVQPTTLFVIDGQNIVPKNLTYWKLGDPNTNFVANTLQLGGEETLNQLSGIFVGQGTVNLAVLASSTAPATSSLTISHSEGATIPVGTNCRVSLTTAPTTTPYLISGIVSTNATNGSTSVATTTVVVTQQAFGAGSVTVATGTATAECHTYGL